MKIGEYNALDNKLDLTRGTAIKWKGKDFGSLEFIEVIETVAP